MTTQDFTDWYRDLKSWLPAVDKWLGNMPDEQRRNVLARWKQTLNGLTLEQAIIGTQRLYRDGQDALGRQWEFIPQKIVAAIDKSTEHRTFHAAGGSAVHRCGECRDCGTITVWHPNAIKQATRELAIDGEWTGTRDSTCAVRCDCAAGKRYATLPVVSDEWHRVDSALTHDDQRAALVAALS